MIQLPIINIWVQQNDKPWVYPSDREVEARLRKEAERRERRLNRRSLAGFFRKSA